MAADIPRGIEVLVKKASVDPEFRELLLEKRAEAAEEIGLELAAAEKAILSAIPREQLEAIIGQTRVPSRLVPVFLGTVAAVMLAALGVTVCNRMAVITLGNSADIPPQGRSPATTQPAEQDNLETGDPESHPPEDSPPRRDGSP